MTCVSGILKEDILRLCLRKDGGSYYLNLVNSGVDIGDTEPIECWETLGEDDIYRLLLTTDGDGNYALNCVLVDDGDESIACVDSHTTLDILRQRIRTDGEFYYLVVNGVNEPQEDGLELTYDDIGNTEIADVNDVSQWNTFFNLPANGTPFDSVSVNGNTVTLYGGGGITLSEYLFEGYNYFSGLVSIDDKSGVIEAALFASLSGSSGLISISLPVCTTAGDYCFTYSSGLTSVSLPTLTTAGQGCFRYCPALTSVSLPMLTTAGQGCFNSCTSLTSVSLPSCTDLGTSTGDDGVFEDILGNTITLTVPAALMTCDGGNPDGDIVYLNNNNTLTVVQV